MPMGLVCFNLVVKHTQCLLDEILIYFLFEDLFCGVVLLFSVRCGRCGRGGQCGG